MRPSPRAPRWRKDACAASPRSIAPSVIDLSCQVPVGMLVRACVDQVSDPQPLAGRHAAVAILSYTTVGAGGRVAQSFFRFVGYFSTARTRRSLKRADVSIFPYRFAPVKSQPEEFHSSGSASPRR